MSPSPHRWLEAMRASPWGWSQHGHLTQSGPSRRDHPSCLVQTNVRSAILYWSHSPVLAPWGKELREGWGSPGAGSVYEAGTGTLTTGGSRGSSSHPQSSCHRVWHMVSGLLRPSQPSPPGSGLSALPWRGALAALQRPGGSGRPDPSPLVLPRSAPACLPGQWPSASGTH